jgi:hypothetical protein
MPLLSNLPYHSGLAYMRPINRYANPLGLGRKPRVHHRKRTGKGIISDMFSLAGLGRPKRRVVHRRKRTTGKGIFGNILRDIAPVVVNHLLKKATGGARRKPRRRVVHRRRR